MLSDDHAVDAAGEGGSVCAVAAIAATTTAFVGATISGWFVDHIIQLLSPLDQLLSTAFFYVKVLRPLLQLADIPGPPVVLEVLLPQPSLAKVSLQDPSTIISG